MIPPPSHTQKALSAGCENRNFDRNEKRSRSPAGPRRLRNSDAHHAHRCPEGFLHSSGAHPAKTQKRQSTPFCPLATQGFRTAQNGQRVEIAPPSKAPLFRPVSRCVRFFSESRGVYPLSLVKANVGRLCEKLKIGMKSGLKQRCGGNFLAIFAGTVLSEKSNFTGRFFER